MQIGILESEGFSQQALSQLKQMGEVSIFDGGDLNRFCVDKEVLFVRLKYFLNEEFLRHAKALKFLCTPTTGLNHIDWRECQRRGIEILSLKGEAEFLANIRATPEHTLGLIIALLRNYSQVLKITSVEACDRELYKGHELFGNRVGIIGFGRVGRIMSHYLKAFDAEVRYFDISDEIEGDGYAQRVDSLEQLIESSQTIILSASYTSKNEMMVNRHHIDMMADRYFVNTARGELVDEDYLFERVKSGAFRGVAIDVIRDETDPQNFRRWLEIDNGINFILAPHIAGATHDSMHRTEEFILEKLHYRLMSTA